MKTRTFQITRWIVTALIVGALAWYVYANRNEVEIFQNLQPGPLLILLVITIIASFVSSTQYLALFRSLGVKIGVWECFELSNVGAAASLFIPQGNSLVKMAYLKQNYGIPLSRSPVMFLGLLVIFIYVGGFILLAANIISVFMSVNMPIVLWVVSVGAILSAVIFWIDIPAGFTNRLGRIGNLLREFITGWQELRKDRRCLVEVSIFEVANFLLAGLMVWAAYNALGRSIHPLLGVGLIIFISFSNLFVITPANIGVQEAFYGVLSQMAGYEFVYGVAVSAVMRAATLAVTILFAPPSWYFLIFRKNIGLNLNQMKNQPEGPGIDQPVVELPSGPNQRNI